MDISLKFNDMNIREMEEIEKEVAEEQAKLTEEEKELQQKQLEEDFQKLLIAAEKDIAEKQQMIDQGKVDLFREICRSAVLAAKDFDLNIEVKDSSNGLYGTIKFEADCIMLVGSAPKLMKKRFCQVLEAADEILISNREDHVEILLSYNFY